MRPIVSTVGVLLVATLAACGSPEPDSVVAAFTKSIDWDHCTSATPDAVIDVGSTWSSAQSPTLYNNPLCEKAWVTETSAPLPTDPAIFSAIRVRWADPWPRNKSQCLNGGLNMALLDKPPGAAEYGDRYGDFQHFMTWDAVNGRCEYPVMKIRYTGQGLWQILWIKVVDRGTHIVSEEVDIPFYRLGGVQMKFPAFAFTPSGTRQPIIVEWLP
jgi:hypothetical protein